jgi:hypothetical protein
MLGNRLETNATAIGSEINAKMAIFILSRGLTVSILADFQVRLNVLHALIRLLGWQELPRSIVITLVAHNPSYYVDHRNTSRHGHSADSKKAECSLFKVRSIVGKCAGTEAVYPQCSTGAWRMGLRSLVAAPYLRAHTCPATQASECRRSTFTKQSSSSFWTILGFDCCCV